MVWMRALLYGVPAALLLFLVAAFLNATRVTATKANEMANGSTVEPSNLNPILSADSAASEVQSVIFNGLLKYDQNLEITGDLAKSWSMRQTTTFFAPTPADALAVAAKLESLRDRWAAWSLQSVRTDGLAILLDLTLPGLDTSREIFETLQTDNLDKLHIVRVGVKSSARESLDLFLQTAPSAPFIVRRWIDTSSAFELTVQGDPAPLVSDLKTYYASQPSLEATVETGEMLDFLAEPEVTFLLQPNVRWHDGEPFTSRDAAFTFRSLIDETVGSPRKSDFELVSKVETPDDLTFRVTYRKPFSPALGSWMIPLIPAHILEGKPAAWWAEHFNRSPIGTGPFKFDEWRVNEYVRVVRNPGFFRGSPWLESIVFRVLPDQLALRLAFETRQVDFWSADPWAVGTVQKDPRFTVFSYPSASYSYVGWNLRRPLFQDQRVRQALAQAVNVPGMIKYILYGNGVQSTGPFTPQLWFFNPNVEPFPYDPVAAGKLLDEAGWVRGPDGIRVRDGKRFSFTLITSSASETRRDIATLVQDNLRAIGVEVVVETYEWVVFVTKFVSKGNFDACVLGWTVPPDYDLFQVWHSSQSNPDQLNMVAYNNPKVDQWLSQIRQEFRREEIIRIAGEIQSTIYADQPYLFLYVPQATAVMWNEAYRICRPGPDGTWIDEPVEITKAGWSYWSDYFYRPEHPPAVLATGKVIRREARTP